MDGDPIYFNMIIGLMKGMITDALSHAFFMEGGDMAHTKDSAEDMKDRIDVTLMNLNAMTFSVTSQIELCSPSSLLKSLV